MVEFARLIRVAALDRPGEVGQFVRVIGERIVSGSVLEQEFRFLDRDMLERDGALDFETPGLAGEVGNRNAIVEDVVNPAEPVRTRRDLEARMEQPLIVAVARAQHHPMLAEPHRRCIGIGREMSYRENGHARPIG